MRIFEVQSNLLDPKALLSEEQQAASDETLTRGERQRRGLARWRTRARRKALRARSFDATNAGFIDALITREFDGFRGAEQPGSRVAAVMMERINGYRPGAARVCLADRLRDYQIIHAAPIDVPATG
jgi:hypothetical protein